MYAKSKIAIIWSLTKSAHLWSNVFGNKTWPNWIWGFVLVTYPIWCKQLHVSQQNYCTWSQGCFNQLKVSGAMWDMRLAIFLKISTYSEFWNTSAYKRFLRGIRCVLLSPTWQRWQLISWATSLWLTLKLWGRDSYSFSFFIFLGTHILQLIFYLQIQADDNRAALNTQPLSFQVQDEMEQDPMGLPLLPCPQPAFCLWKNFSQRISVIRGVGKYRSKGKQSKKTT